MLHRYTETGGVTIAPHPAPKRVKPKPGFSMKPFYGVLPVLVDEQVKYDVIVSIIGSVS